MDGDPGFETSRRRTSSDDRKYVSIASRDAFEVFERAGLFIDVTGFPVDRQRVGQMMIGGGDGDRDCAFVGEGDDRGWGEMGPGSAESTAVGVVELFECAYRNSEGAKDGADDFGLDDVMFAPDIVVFGFDARETCGKAESGWLVRGGRKS